MDMRGYTLEEQRLERRALYWHRRAVAHGALEAMAFALYANAGAPFSSPERAAEVWRAEPEFVRAHWRDSADPYLAALTSPPEAP